MSEYYNENGIHYESYREYIFIELLGFCGCYDEQLFDDMFKVLLALDVKEGIAPYYNELGISPPVYVELILHNLDRLDFVEHGTSIRGSWLTDKGIEAAAIIREEIGEESNDDSNKDNV